MQICFSTQIDFLALLQYLQFGSIKWAICKSFYNVAGPNSKLRTPLNPCSKFIACLCLGTVMQASLQIALFGCCAWLSRAGPCPFLLACLQPRLDLAYQLTKLALTHAIKTDDVYAGSTCIQAVSSIATWPPGLSLQRLPQPLRSVVSCIQAPDQGLPK